MPLHVPFWGFWVFDLLNEEAYQQNSEKLFLERKDVMSCIDCLNRSTDAISL